MTATHTTRTTRTSTPSRAASPAHTPPTIPFAGSRRNGRSTCCGAVSVSTVPIVSVAREAGDEQHGAHGREDRGRRVVEAQVDDAREVEDEQDAEQRHRQAGDDGHEVRAAPHV